VPVEERRELEVVAARAAVAGASRRARACSSSRPNFERTAFETASSSADEALPSARTICHSAADASNALMRVALIRSACLGSRSARSAFSICT
jgi:hypothetical protein